MNKEIEVKIACAAGLQLHSRLLGLNISESKMKIIRQNLRAQVLRAIENGYCHFVSGMDLGVGVWFALTIIDLKKQYPHIRLEASIPFEEQARYWSTVQRFDYYYALKRCDKVTYISKLHHNECKKQRDRYMLGNSSLLFAVCNHAGEKDDGCCILQLAKEKGISVVCIDV